jgi:pimeloyl-ACP methyl ester carboxylesterase
MFRSTLGARLALALAAAASTASPAFAASPFAHPQQMVDIGGRRLHLYCSGEGPVTVVYDSGSGDAGWAWQAVQPEIAKRTRACVYDRAGLGFSDPSPLPGTSVNAVADLHALLGKGGVKPPYVLVGHSYGGANVQLYAYRHPDEVKGLVLVEPFHEDLDRRLDAVSQGKMKQATAMNDEMGHRCAAQSEQGFAPGSEMFAICSSGYDPGVPRDLAAVRLADVTSARYWRAAESENGNLDASGDQLRAVRRSFGALPLVVLTRGVSPFAVPGKPQSPLNKAFEDENRKIHLETAALSTRGREHVVPGADHGIPYEQPQAVVRAVNEVLDQLAP